MKVEHRHDMHQNQLADWMADKYVDVKPYLTTILAGAVAVAAIWVAYSWYTRSAETAAADTWNTFYKNVTTGDDDLIRSFIREHSGEPVATVARQRLGLRLMTKAAASQLTNREQSRAMYQEAIDLFSQVRDETDDVSLQRFASYQVAVARESRYDLDEAIAAYTKIVEQWPDSMEGQRAKLRLEDLKRPATKEFYEWHKTATPATTPPPTAPVAPVEPSTDLDKLPPTDPMPPAEPMPPADTKPDETKPEEAKPAETKPEESKPEEAKPADAPKEGEAPAETPKEGEAKPAEATEGSKPPAVTEEPAPPAEKPAETPKPPEEAKPAEETKPAEEKPAEIKPPE